MLKNIGFQSKILIEILLFSLYTKTFPKFHTLFTLCRQLYDLKLKLEYNSFNFQHITQ